MAERIVVVDANDLLQLMIHYWDGKAVPLNSEVKEVGISRKLQRVISLLVASKDWGDEEVSPVSGELFPLELAYEGKRVMSWASKGDEVVWADANDNPQQQ